jgi:apolipoprotein N-acyltransferase
MLIWNIGATWWIWNSTGPGAIAAILANSLLMCAPWILFHWVHKRMGHAFGYSALVVFWLSFEYFHLQNWGLSWPWLTIGNVFASHPGWVQWYEYTGVSGGGLWIWIMNILLFLLLWDLVQHKRFGRRKALIAALLLIVPLVGSVILTPGLPDKTYTPDIVIIQPNIDPYEKVETGTFDAQLHKAHQAERLRHRQQHDPRHLARDSIGKWRFRRRPPQRELFPESIVGFSSPPPPASTC